MAKTSARHQRTAQRRDQRRAQVQASSQTATAPTTLAQAIAQAKAQWQQSNPSGQGIQGAYVGGYTGARQDRAQTAGWITNIGSINTDTVLDLRTLRGRSSDAIRNAPVALGAINTTVAHSIGTGLSYSPAIDGEFLGLSDEDAEDWAADTKRRFETWAHSPDCDLARQYDFYGLQGLAYRSALERGDAFALTPRPLRNGKPTLALQLIEADRICNPQYGANTPSRIEGIEINPDTGEPLIAHVARYHPGGMFSGAINNEWTPVAFRGAATGRRNILQVYKPLRPGQVRGVPWIAPILEPLKQLQRWSDSELNAAVVSSLNATFITMDGQAFQDIYDEETQGAYANKAGKWSGEIESGQAINLLPGESIESPTPGRPNPAFDPFWQAMVRQIGMALEIPVEVLTMHFQSSYSAARGAMLMAWKFFRGQRDLMAKTFCQPVFELWLADEVAEGRIAAPGFFTDPVVRAAWCRAQWIGDAMGSLNPTDDVNAAEKRINLGISTKQAESIAYNGVDWQDNHEQRVKEINAEKEDGIWLPPPGTPAMLPGAQTPMEDGQPIAPDQPDDQPGTTPAKTPASTPGRKTAHLPTGPHGPTANVAQAAPGYVSHQAFAALDAKIDALQTLLAQFAQAQAQAQAQAAPVQHHIHLPEQRHEIHNHLPAPVVQTDVHVPETTVNVEAVMPSAPAVPAPVVNITNDVQPAPVTVNNAFAARATQTVETDPTTGDIVRTVTDYTV